MSSTGHDQQASAEAQAAAGHAAQYDPSATTTTERCRTRVGGAARPSLGDLCWSSVTNPTDTHLAQAEQHRRHAADHRGASTALRDAEERSCAGVAAEDRDTSPFEHVEDIASVERGTAGAVVTFRAVPGMSAERLQLVVDCHLARNASLGHVVPEMPNCPLVPKGVEARVTAAGSGFAITIRSSDDATAREIFSRAQRLRPVPVAAVAPPSK